MSKSYTIFDGLCHIIVLQCWTQTRQLMLCFVAFCNFSQKVKNRKATPKRSRLAVLNDLLRSPCSRSFVLMKQNYFTISAQKRIIMVAI